MWFIIKRHIKYDIQYILVLLFDFCGSLELRNLSLHATHKYSPPLPKSMPYSLFSTKKTSALWVFFNLYLVTNLVQCIVELWNTWDTHHYASGYKMATSPNNARYCDFIWPKISIQNFMDFVCQYHFTIQTIYLNHTLYTHLHTI